MMAAAAALRRSAKCGREALDQRFLRLDVHFMTQFHLSLSLPSLPVFVCLCVFPVQIVSQERLCPCLCVHVYSACECVCRSKRE